MKKMLLLAAVALTVLSCKEDNKEDVVATPEKKGGREVVLSSIVLGDSTKHTTTERIWIDGIVIKENSHSFTTINPKKVKDTIEDEEGNLKVVERDNKLPIFVTVQ